METNIQTISAEEPAGWETLKHWGKDVVRLEPLSGGVANCSSRHRSDADLAWGTELLQYLDHNGLAVPVPIPTTDGRLFVDGMVVMTYIGGSQPETKCDWRCVADTLCKLHLLTQGRGFIHKFG